MARRSKVVAAPVEKGLLAATGLTLWRGTTLLFDELALQLAPGEVLLVQGANGAGKTSLLRVLAGLTEPDAGDVTWQGKPLRSAIRTGSLRLAFAGHNLALKLELTARENLQFHARLVGGDSGAGPAIDEVLAATGLTDCAGLPVRLLSAGQKRRVSLARVLLSGSGFWLLDEPQTNLDAAGREFLARVLTAHLGRGGMLALAAHEPIALGSHPTTRLTMGMG